MSGNYEITSRTNFEDEAVLPLEVIREHTKTDDTPTVTDRQIELYRKTSFEQAELYTGRIIFGHAKIMEPIRIDGEKELDRHKPRRTMRYKLAFSPNEKYVLVGGRGGSPQNVPIDRNTRKIDIPATCFTFDLGNCCAGNGLNMDAVATYSTGYKNKDDIPSTILYGCLKFIAWAVNNPGDELLTVRNRLGTTETGLIGTNNGAWASGAIEHWRTYKVS
jgi:hypothetical protein